MLFGMNKNEKMKKAFDNTTGNYVNEHSSSARCSISSTSTTRSVQQRLSNDLLSPEPINHHTRQSNDITYDDEEDFMEGADLERSSDECRDDDEFLEYEEDNEEHEEDQEGGDFDDNFLWNVRQLCARQGGTRLFSEEEPFFTSSEVQTNLAKLEKYTRKMMEDERKNKRVFKETTDTLRHSLNEHKKICVSKDEFQATIRQLVNCIQTLKNTIISLNGAVPPLDIPTLDDEGTSSISANVERRTNRRRGRGNSNT